MLSININNWKTAWGILDPRGQKKADSSTSIASQSEALPSQFSVPPGGLKTRNGLGIVLHFSRCHRVCVYFSCIVLERTALDS